MPTNSQGLTLEQMSTSAGNNLSPADTIAKSQANPGTLVVGGQTGVTPTNNMIAPTPTNYQALTTPKTPLIQDNANPNVLSSSDANAYVKNVQADLGKTAEGNIQANGDVVNPNYDANGNVVLGGQGTPNALTVNKPNSAMGPEYNPADPIGSMARMAYAPIKEKIQEQYQPVREGMTSQQRGQTLTEQAAEFKSGVAGTTYGYQVMNDLAIGHQREITQLNQQEQDALNRAWDATLRGSVGDVMQAQKEQDSIQQQKQAAQQNFYKQQSEMVAAEKASKAEVSDTIDTYLKGGNEPTQTQLDYWDKRYGLESGSSKILLDASKSDQQWKQESNELKQRDTAVESAKKLTDYLDAQPLGSKITIGGIDYYGTGKGNLRSGVSVDKATGQGLYYEFNPETGKTTTTPMGTVGFGDPNWQLKSDDQGRLWRVSADSGTMLPMTPGPTQKTNAAVYPDGQKGPTLPGHEYNAGQCGAACNAWYGKPLLPDSFQGKQQVLSSYSVPVTDIQTHDTILMKAGTTGHVGVIGDTWIDQITGKTMFSVTESNYVPPNQGLLSNTRVMAADDPRIAMFARVPTPNLPASGSDSSTTMAASGVPTFGAKNETTNEKPLTATDLKAFGLDPTDPKNANLTRSDVQAALTAQNAALKDQPLDDRAKAEIVTMNPDQAAKWQAATPEDRDLARQLVNGDMTLADYSSRAASGTTLRAKYDQLARVLDPTFSPTEMERRNTFKTNFTTGKLSDSLKAITTTVSHLKDLKESADTVTSKRLSSHIPGSNIAGDFFANITGTSGDLKAYNENAQALASELTNVFRNSGGTEADIKGWQESLNDRNSPSENKKALQKGVDLMSGRVKAIHDQYKRAMGGQEPAQPIISREDVNAIKDMGFDVSKLERYSLGAPPEGQIWVKMGDQIGSIPSSEFDPKKYAKII